MVETKLRPSRFMLFDNHNRKLNYLRLAVTDRCNLRCQYCMPEQGLRWLSRSALLSYEELLRACELLVGMGIEKIRITGGEPFVRKDISLFIRELAKLDGLRQINLTTNGVLTAPHVQDFPGMKIRSCNLSLDTLSRERFFEITRRDEFPAVMRTLDELLKHGIQTKINMVVMAGVNADEIVPMVGLAKNLPVSVRFIEEMPFNGDGHAHSGIEWNFAKILKTISEKHPIEKMPDPPNSTSANYKIPGFQGSFGIIAAYSRSFCGTCNRIRLTPEGGLRTCLYGEEALNLRDLLRGGFSGDEIRERLLEVFKNRAKDGWEAERLRREKGVFESMAAIGG